MTASAQLGTTGVANGSARADAARLAASDAEIDLAWPSEVVIVRGEDRADLLRSIEALLTQISRQPNLRLVDVAFTLNKALLPDGARLAIVATDLSDLARRLALAKESLADPNTKRLRDPSGAYFETEPLAKRGDLALLFPGEGTQYLGMLADLPAHYPEVRERLGLFDAYVGPDGEDQDSVSRFFAPPASFTEEHKSRLERRLRQLDNALFAVLAADWAVLSFLQELQLNVAAVAGHSAGELAALVAAGSIDVSTHNQSIIEGMRALGDAEALSQSAEAMLLATSASRETLEKVIGGIAGAIVTGPNQNIFVAMDNCPHQSVVVGLSATVEKLEAALKRDRVVCERLPFSRPYHTPLFAPFMGPLTEMFDTVEFFSPQTRIYSCTTGRPFPNDPESIRQGAMSHWTSPVEFRRMIQNMHTAGVRIFIEAGPRGVLSAFVQDILRGQEFVALPVDLPRRSALTQINHLVAQLAVHQAQFNFDLLYRRRVEQVDLGETRSESRATESSAAPTTATAATPSMAAPNHVGPAAGTSAPTSIHQTPASRLPMNGPAAVMARHLNVMERFLAAQQAATRDYLQTRSQRQTPAPRNAARGVLRTPLTPSTPAAPMRPTSQREATPSLPQSTPIATRQAASTAFQKAVSPAVSPVARGELPMAGVIVSHTPDIEMVTRRRLDLSEDRYADDHAVGGQDISRLNPLQRGLPVMPMTFILEMLAEAAARLVPDRVVIAVRDIQLQRWLAFDGDATPTVEIVARRRPAIAAGDIVEVDVEVTNLGAEGLTTSTRGTVTVGVVELALDFPQIPTAAPFVLQNERESRVPVDTLYRGLFHGPMFRGVRSMDCYGDAQATATLEVLPRKGLFRSTDHPNFLIDPVTLDVSLHTGAGWHLEQEDQAGRILLPFELKRVELFGPPLLPGTRLIGRSSLTQESPRHFCHDGEVLRTDGTVWRRLIGVKSWRFYLPFGQVNFNGPKDEYFISYVWPSIAPLEPDDDVQPAVCVRLDPSGDLTQTGMQEVAACVCLSTRELREFRTRRLGAVEKSAWLFDRVAAKDAARVWWRKRTGDRQFMADLDVDIDPRGRHAIRLCAGARPEGYPIVAVDGVVGAIFALATSRPWAGVGVTRIDSVDAQSDWSQLEPEEQQAVSKPNSTGEVDQPSELTERMARVIAARKAVRNALGPALIPRLEQLQIRDWDASDQSLTLTLDRSLFELFPEAQGQSFTVRTFVEGPAVIATFVGGPQ